MSILTEIVTFRKRTNENEGRAAECLKCREEYQSNQRKELMLKKRNEAEAQLLMESVTIIQQTSQEIEDLFNQYSEYSDLRLQELQDLFAAIKAEPLTSSTLAEQVKKRCFQLKIDLKKAGEAAIHASHLQMIRNVRKSFERNKKCMKMYRKEIETSRNRENL